MKKAFCAYQDYIGLKLHFNADDFIWRSDREYKFGSVNTFLKRKDVQRFAYFVDQFKRRDDMIEYLISGFLFNKRLWIGDALLDDVKESHCDRIKRSSALMYTFRNECDVIDDYMSSKKMELKCLLKISDSNIPQLVKMRDRGDIHYETLAIFDKFFNFTSQSLNNMLWDEERLKISKYKYFLTIDNMNIVKKQINQLLAHT